MLKAIRIRNFKSFRAEARLPLGSLTLLIGANASGKSNALEAVRLLKWIGEGQRLGNIRYQIQDSDSAIRGRVQDLFFDTTAPLSLGLDFDNGEWERFELDLHFREQDKELHVAHEGMYGTRAPFLYEVAGPASFPGTDIQVAYNNFARGGKKPQITCSDQMGVFTQLLTPARFNASHKQSQTEVPKACRAFQRALGLISFLDPKPYLMRGYASEQDYFLNESGSNVSSVISNIISPGRSNISAEASPIVEALDATMRLMEFSSIIEKVPEHNVSGISVLSVRPEGLRVRSMS